MNDRQKLTRATLTPVGKEAASVTVSRPLLKQLIKGGARIVGRAA
jgi:hypothetical protein